MNAEEANRVTQKNLKKQEQRTYKEIVDDLIESAVHAGKFNTLVPYIYMGQKEDLEDRGFKVEEVKNFPGFKVDWSEK